MGLEEEIGLLLTARGLTLATAESCTGGLLGHRITNVPGSSAYYLGGWVTYSNEAKERLLGVRRETLEHHGAVSEPAAREMARGARERLGADIAVAVTGIAGPTGGTPDKPVGLLYIALSAADAELCERHAWQGGRLANKEQSAAAALRLVLSYLRARRAPEEPPLAGADRRKAKAGGGEPVQVEVRPRRDGTPLPVGFFWQGRRYQVESWGRERTEEKEGRERRCYLVQTAGAETWELCQEIETGQWRVARHWPGRRRTV